MRYTRSRRRARTFLRVRPARGMDLRVTRSEGRAGAAAAGHVVRLADDGVLVGPTSRIAERAGGGDTDAAVAALSQALGAFRREIATAVRAEQAAGHERPRTRPRA